MCCHIAIRNVLDLLILITDTIQLHRNRNAWGLLLLMHDNFGAATWLLLGLLRLLLCRYSIVLILMALVVAVTFYSAIQRLITAMQLLIAATLLLEIHRTIDVNYYCYAAKSL